MVQAFPRHFPRRFGESIILRFTSVVSDRFQIFRRKRKLRPQVVAGKIDLRLRRAASSAGFEDAPNAAAPGLDLPGAEEGVGYAGVVGVGGVVAEELGEIPTFGQDGGIPDLQPVSEDFDLDGGGDRVVAVDQGVEHGLAQCFVGDGIGLDALQALVADGRLQVFGPQ